MDAGDGRPKPEMTAEALAKLRAAVTAGRTVKAFRPTAEGVEVVYRVRKRRKRNGVG